MKTMHEIEVELVSDAGEAHPAAALLGSTFTANRTKYRNVYRFSNLDELNTFVSFVELHQMPFQQFYVFVLDRDEIRDQPGFYFAVEMIFDLIVDGQVNPQKLNKNDVALDYHSETIVATPRIQHLLEPLAPGARWRPLAARNGRQYTELELVGSLPDPISIPRPVEIAERQIPPGTYAVRSDGRDVISEASARELTTLGVARSDHVKVAGEKVLTSPRRLVSGRVLETLMVSNVKGILLPPVPLLLPSHAAAHSDDS